MFRSRWAIAIITLILTMVLSNPLNIESENEGEEFIFENDMIVFLVLCPDKE